MQRDGLDFTMVNYMERISVPLDDLQHFITEGRLNRGDAEIPPVFMGQADDDFTLVDAYFLGRAVAANILSHYRPYTANPALTQYLNHILQTLVINSNKIPAFNGYRVMVLDTNEVNAFASLGGHIFLTRGLVELAASEDVLAAVLAHELAHIKLQHSIAIINEARFVADMSAIATRALGIAGRTSPEAARLASLRNYLSSTIDVLMRNGYSQTQEFEADAEAVAILVRAGYNPRALLEMLRILQQAQGLQMSGLHSTHPSPVFRISNVERVAVFEPASNEQYRLARFRNLRL
jgi:predicted Zn-dependent protease